MSTTLVSVLRDRAEQHPGRLALAYTDGGRTTELTFAAVDETARALATVLAGSGLRPGDRALLLYQPGLDYVAGFLGCLYCGVIAVPAFPPRDQRSVARIQSIAADADAKLSLTDQATFDVFAGSGLSRVQALTMRDVTQERSAAWTGERIDADQPAFLQYTSGSTAEPRGVVVTHRNLVSNSLAIAAAVAADEHSRAVSWLPPYHDMGLIGGVLQPLFSGFPGYLMSPLSFLREPLGWLRAISDFGGTCSPAPNFAYDECVRRIDDADVATLDLSRWRSALVGAEPVNGGVLNAFAEKFAPAGFAPSAFMPCYGLAEATLFVTGVKRAALPARRTIARADTAAGQVHDSAAGAGLVGCGLPGPTIDVAVVGPEGHAVPHDTVGEIWVHGPSVASGYWGRTGDEQLFGLRRTDDQTTGWLRTGDLGFLDAAGELFVTGRRKDVLILRGANHYPQDIELTVQQAHPDIRPGRVAAFAVAGPAGEQAVVAAESVTRDARAATEAAFAVQEAVTRAHGIALREVVLLRRGGIPRTSSGKVQRYAVREAYLAGRLPRLSLAGAGVPASGGGLPGGAAGQLVASVLELAPDQLAPDLPLVAQGLDSLRAARLMAGLAGIGLDLSMAALLGPMTPADLAALAPAAPPDPIPRLPDNVTDAAPSFGQEQLWAVDQLGRSAAYHMLAVTTLAGPVDIESLRQAADLLVRRHEALRTALHLDGEGQVCQRICEPRPVPVTELAAPSEQAWLSALSAWSAQPFSLTEGRLVRISYGQLPGPATGLAFCAHHIAVDAISMRVLAAELATAYRSLRRGEPPSLPEIAVRQRDVASWQRQEKAGAGLSYWRQALAGARAPDLPLPSSSGPAPAGTVWAPMTIPADAVSRLSVLAAEESSTLFMALAAGFAALLARWSGEQDVLFGTAAAGRPHPDAAEVVGFFANVLPLRVDLAGGPTWRQALRCMRAACLAAYQHADVPFEQVSRAARGTNAGTAQATLIRHLLVLHGAGTELDLDGLRGGVSVRPAPEPRFDVEVQLTRQPGGALTGSFSWSDRLLAGCGEGLAEGLRLVCEAAAREPDQRISDLPVLGAATQARQLHRATGGPAVTRPPAAAAFAGQARTRPGAVAVAGADGTTLTYARLAAEAAAIASHVLQRTPGPESRVGVLLHHGWQLNAAILGILAAGRTYLPLDPGHPPSRIAAVLDDAAADLLLTSAPTSGAADTGRLPVCIIPDTPAAPPGGELPSPPEHPDHAAYLLYTSGSTGRPKGALNTAGGLANRLAWAEQLMAAGPADRILQKTPISFDVSVWELLLPFTTGAVAVPVRPGGHRDPRYLHRLMRDQKVTICHFVPSMLSAFLDLETAGLPDLRLVVVSGEELPPACADRVHEKFPQARLLNLYGPTEAAIDVSAHEVDHRAAGPVPIGVAVPGTSLHVLTDRYQQQPAGATGQLFIGGVQLARGYHGRPGLTAAAFVPDPFRPGARLYATGDLARWRPDGVLEFLGRADRQIKIRGQRVEPGEVEAVFAEYPAVQGVAVVAFGQPPALRLAAFVTAPSRLDTGELRDFAAERLPSAMVPAVIHQIDELPLLGHGKLDRASLAARAGPDLSPSGGEPGTPPRNHMERVLARMWAEVLGTGMPGLDDDFLAAGGDSLLAVRLLNRVSARFGVELAVDALLGRTATVASLAELVLSSQAQQATEEELLELLSEVEQLGEDEVRSRLARLDGPEGEP